MTSLRDKDRRYLWHPFTQMRDWMAEEPVIIASGDGAILRDAAGQEYIDANSSIWTNLHGHRHPKITQAITDQLDRIAHSSFLGLSNVPAIELAEKLVQIAPHGLARVFYSDDGSTAVEVAIKMALQYWQHKQQPQRKKFVAFADAYHGDTLGAVSVGGIDLFHAAYKPLTFAVVRVAELARWQDVLDDSVAAVVIEPLIQGAGGMKLWPRGLLKELRERCTRTGALLVADEVLTGFGRTGKMFACEHEGVTPDLMAVAKGLTGGYLPLAATLTTAEIFNAFLGEYAEFKTFFHGHSYTGNQLGCAAALANLQVFEEERTFEKLSALSSQLSAGLERLRGLPAVRDVRYLGFIGAVEIGPYPIEQKMGIQVCSEMRRRGVLTRPLGNTIVLMPPYCITERQLDHVLSVLAESIAAVIG
ncbi:MAG TPA: adenosylmethionine--8-amino-7-oxononanoate transaminase [Verrucomicrobiae bacterium]|nr:adenosylmethionine--8-amino-7-oxononanoate transaminase [Verrucomicrobiae bacterium]